MTERSTSSAPVSPACPPRVRLTARGTQRGGARGDRVRRRPLPFLSRCRGRHDHRQRQSSVAVRQSRGARLSARASAPQQRLIGPDARGISFRRSRAAASAGRCVSTTAACRSGFSTPRGACQERARSIIWRWRGCCGRARARRVGEVIACEGTLYRRLVEPLLLAALNIDPPHGSAKLAAAVMRETLAAGGRACRPLIARDGLGPTLDRAGAGAVCKQRGATVRFEHQLRAIRFGGDRVEALDFGGEAVALAADDAVILAVPPYAAASLVRDLEVPTEFRAIVNAHFRIDPPAGTAADPRRAQWHRAMDVRLSGPRCRSPSAPATG